MRTNPPKPFKRGLGDFYFDWFRHIITFFQKELFEESGNVQHGEIARTLAFFVYPDSSTRGDEYV